MRRYFSSYLNFILKNGLFFLLLYTFLNKRKKKKNKQESSKGEKKNKVKFVHSTNLLGSSKQTQQNVHRKTQAEIKIS